MASFRYQYGDRPLDGYTIEHGVGRGGFGEVYYAVSDSGRQVALKAVQNYEDIELRGISHCMNLKSPHLVTIFDVKFNDRGDPFVIMEFVSGPSLRQLLDEAPNGLGPEKAAFFLREIGKGLTYLHDRGVVHRDLKPHNVFYEDGIVKIGDYSLSKAITTSHRSGHTITVGTVHYMAPEVSMGRYGPSVDIYALGIMLYEMLRGDPPFTGQSMGEVLMKHMTAEPDLTGIDEPFASTIRRALAKEPDDRFPSAMEMVESVFGSDRLQASVHAFDPASLSVIAHRVGQQVAVGAGGSGGLGRAQAVGAGALGRGLEETAAIVEATPVEAHRAEPVAPVPQHVFDHRPTEWTAAAAKPADGPVEQVLRQLGIAGAPEDDPASDPLSLRQRWQFALATLLAMTMVLTIVSEGLMRNVFGVIALSLLMLSIMVALSAAILWTRRNLIPRLHNESVLIQRLAFAGVALAAGVATAVVGLLVTFPFQAGTVLRRGPTTLLACVVPLLLWDWRAMTRIRRPHRLVFIHVLAVGVIAIVAATMFDGLPPIAGGVMAAVAMAVQLMSPWHETSLQEASSGHASSQRASCWASRMRRPSPPQSPPHSPPPRPQPASQSPHFGDEPLQAVAATDVGSRAAASTRPAWLSHKSRLVMLLLSTIPMGFGVAGLHRLYAGRVISGIIWLLTWGVLGVGQLIDIILIAVGQFRDGDGRLIVDWNPQYDHRDVPVNAWSSVHHPVPSTPASQFGLGRLFDYTLAFVGAICVAVALAAGLFATFKVPSVMVAMAGQSGLSREFAQLTRELGPSWPQMFIHLATLLAVAAGIVGGGLLMISRRHSSLLHVMRVVVAAFFCACGLISAGSFLTETHWMRAAYEFNGGDISDGIMILLGREQVMGLAIGSLIGLFGLLVLAWPYRPRREAAPTTTGQTVEPVQSA